MNNTANILDQFADQKAVLLTSFRKSGVGVPTPVNIVVDGDRAFVKTWPTSGKCKRIRNNPKVTVASSTMRGTKIGSEVPMTAKVVEGSDKECAIRMIEGKHPILQGLLVRLAILLTRRDTAVIELRSQ